MYDVVYIGNVFRTIDILASNKKINIVAVIYQKDKVSNDLLFRYSKYSLIAVTNYQELFDSIQNTNHSIDFAIMYSFGIIIKEPVLELIDIYNFHPGSLLYNRGSSPVNWAILLGWEQTEMTLYKIYSGIDEGNVISIHNCRIYENDTPLSLQFRLEGEMYSMIIDLLAYIDEGKDCFHEVSGGVYRKRICENDYTILPNRDSYNVVRSKINSQADYKGAIVIENGEYKYIKTMKEYLQLFCKNHDKQ